MDQYKAQLNTFLDKSDAAINDYIAKCEKLSSLRDQVQAKVNNPLRPTLTLAAGVVLLSFIFISILGSGAIFNIVAFAYPMYASLKALQTPGKDDDIQLLTYWIVYGLFNTIDAMTSILHYWIPYYALVKLVFLVWCMAPQTRGATKIYETVIAPAFSQVEDRIDAAIQQVQDATAAASGDVKKNE